MHRWGIEYIPNSDLLYYRVNKKKYDEIRKSKRANKAHEFPVGLFSFAGSYLSVDWSKYSTPRQSQNRARVPDDNGIVELKVADVRRERHTVRHVPSEHNRAHSGICGIQPKIRITLQRIARWSEGFEIDSD